MKYASRLINIGFGNMVSAARIIAIISPESAPVKRLIQEAKDRQNRMPRGRASMSARTVPPEVVKPETISKRQSAKL